jgi:hypothetical protein
MYAVCLWKRTLLWRHAPISLLLLFCLKEGRFARILKKGRSPLTERNCSRDPRPSERRGSRARVFGSGRPDGRGLHECRRRDEERSRGPGPDDGPGHRLGSGARRVLRWPSIRGIALLGSTLYLAGTFDTMGGQPRVGLAAVDAITALPTPWNPGINAPMDLIAAWNSTIYVSGTFFAAPGSIDRISRRSTRSQRIPPSGVRNPTGGRTRSRSQGPRSTSAESSRASVASPGSSSPRWMRSRGSRRPGIPIPTAAC